MRRLTRWLDTRWTIPGTRWRFGLDPLLGLVPVVGDVVSCGFSAWSLVEARRAGAPWPLMLSMAGNIILDFVVGAIPLLGDVFDFAFKAHVRNLRMLEKWLASKHE